MAFFEFSNSWFRRVFKINKSKRVEVPASVRRLLPKQCEVCGNTQNLEIHHKVPLCFGGSNKRANLQVLCKTCHEKSPEDIPDSVSLDLTKMLKDSLEKEYDTDILCYELIRR